MNCPIALVRNAPFPAWQRTIVGLFIALSCMSLFAQTLSIRADAPTFKIGDRWKQEQRDTRTKLKIFENVNTITSISSTLVEGTTSDGGTFRWTPELNPIDTPSMAFGGDPKFLSFPLEVGKKWATKYTFANKKNENKGRMQLDVEVLAYEKIAVPAGSFDAFKLEYRGYWNNDANRANGSARSTYWYAPAARAVVKTEYADGFNMWVRELVEFDLQP